MPIALIPPLSTAALELMTKERRGSDPRLLRIPPERHHDFIRAGRPRADLRRAEHILTAALDESHVPRLHALALEMQDKLQLPLRLDADAIHYVFDFRARLWEPVSADAGSLQQTLMPDQVARTLGRLFYDYMNFRRIRDNRSEDYRRRLRAFLLPNVFTNAQHFKGHPEFGPAMQELVESYRDDALFIACVTFWNLLALGEETRIFREDAHALTEVVQQNFLSIWSLASLVPTFSEAYFTQPVRHFLSTLLYDGQQKMLEQSTFLLHTPPVF